MGEPGQGPEIPLVVAASVMSEGRPYCQGQRSREAETDNPDVIQARIRAAARVDAERVNGGSGEDPVIPLQTLRARPVALIVWARRERKRLNIWLGQYIENGGIPAADYHAFLETGRPLFFFMYEQLSPAQRDAESTRLAAAITASPGDETAKSDAYIWHHHVQAWNSERSRARRKAEIEATRAATGALTHCTYLGGYRDFPARAQLCAAIVSIGRGGGFSFRTRSEREICSIPWPEICGLHVLPANDATQPIAPRLRWRSVSLIGKRREAAFRIITIKGDATILVRGCDTSELRDKLAKLSDCIGQPAADAYDQASVRIRSELAAPIQRSRRA